VVEILDRATKAPVDDKTGHSIGGAVIVVWDRNDRWREIGERRCNLQTASIEAGADKGGKTKFQTARQRISSSFRAIDKNVAQRVSLMTTCSRMLGSMSKSRMGISSHPTQKECQQRSRCSISHEQEHQVTTLSMAKSESCFISQGPKLDPHDFAVCLKVLRLCSRSTLVMKAAMKTRA
jgi:hypothetical protein